MNVWNKVLLGLLIVVTGLCFYLGAKLLKIHQAFQQSVADHEVAIEKAKSEQQRLLEGTDGEPGLRETRARLNSLVQRRGGAWRNLTVESISADDPASVQVTLSAPTPPAEELPDAAADDLPPQDASPLASMTPRTLVYAFEQQAPKDGGQFMGYYAVSSLQPGQVTLEPVRPMNQRQIDKLQQSDATWFLQEVAPIDENETFQAMSEEEIRDLLPEAMADRYIEQGEERPLMDYAFLLQNLHRRRAALTLDITTVQNDIASLEAVLADVKDNPQNNQTLFRQNEIETLEARLAEMERERDAVQSHLAGLEEKLAMLQGRVKELLDENASMADQIGRIQSQAARVIDRRSGDVATSAN